MKNSSRRVLNIILALIVSLGAWMFVVYNYYPMTDVKYNDVPLTFEGQRELASRGLAVSEANTKGISVRLSQRRVNFNNYSAKDIKVVANVSECVAGENEVSINVTSPKDTSVLSHDTNTIKVTVERTESEYMDIDVIYSEKTAEDEEPLAIDMGKSSAEVVCASSKLESIKKVAAVLERSEVGESIKSYTAKLVALDGDGNIVPYAVIYPEEVSLDACAGMVKTLKIDPFVIGGSDNDYERKYNIPETVTVKGPVSVMSELESIKAVEMDINNYYADTELAIELDLPENVILVNPDEPPVMKLIVIKKEKPKTEENSAANESAESAENTEENN